MTGGMVIGLGFSVDAVLLAIRRCQRQPHNALARAAASDGSRRCGTDGSVAGPRCGGQRQKRLRLDATARRCGWRGSCGRRPVAEAWRLMHAQSHIGATPLDNATTRRKTGDRSAALRSWRQAQQWWMEHSNPSTPPMAAGLTDHVWSLRDLFPPYRIPARHPHLVKTI
jgi:hypothetical protein